MFKNLAHVCLNVADITKTIEFYNEKIGLPIKFKFEKAGKVMGVYFEVSKSNFIEAFEKPGLKVNNTGITHFCLETDNIEQFISTMESKGIPCTEKKLECDQSWQTWLKDPDGNKIEIHQYTKESAQLQANGGLVTFN